jgi:thioredoxin reductase (NADPH)
MPDVSVYGAPWCPDCRRSKKFLAEHRIAFEWVDIDQDADGLRFVEELQKGGRTIPTIVFADGSHLIEPSDDELARKLGLRVEAQRRFYDLAIVGGGPAGLAAALYAAREGMDTVVLEKGALGGQAGVTERVDNYPGFPEGIGGTQLAERFVAQARRYGVELVAALPVTEVAAENGDVRLGLGNGKDLCAHATILATGSTYRRLNVPGEEGLIGAGVHFCATCDGPFYKGADELLVIGGGNSGLEEGMFLTGFAQRVRIIERGPELRASKLLQDNVRSDPRFIVETNTEVVELKGRGRLEEVMVRDRVTAAERRLHPAAAFVFIGLDPNTAFLRGVVDLDESGFVVTDSRFQTSLAGVFCAGDVRQGSTKQLASAVGEGAAVLLAVRDHLREHHHLASLDVNS